MPERNYFKEAQDAFRLKRERAQTRSIERKKELHNVLPEVAEIDARLSATGSEILSAVMTKEKEAAKEKIEKIRKENESLRERRRRILIQNGYPGDYSDIKYECEKCADSGYVDIDMCSCMKSAIAKARLSDSELGRLSALQSFENFDFGYYSGEERKRMEYNYSCLRSFAENFNSKSTESWLLVGDTGLGKTHLSTAVGVTVIRRGYNVIYKTVQAVIDDFEDVQFKGGSMDEIRRYYDCDLLIVDDLGAEMTNQFTVSCIYNVINTRINKQKPTVFSTNLKQSELRERYADRITSRLFGEYTPLVFKGTDVRRQRLARK